MDQNLNDVIVIGAGASGLMAAYELSLAGKKVVVIEARDRLGGRINTITGNKFSQPVESGAEFIHGNLELTKAILKNAGISSLEIKGELWQKIGHELSRQGDFIEDYSDLEKKFKELTHDIPVSRFIEDHLQGSKYEELKFTLKNYVEGYYAADIFKASTFALCEDLTTSDEEQFRVNGGYSLLVKYLAEESIKRGCSFHYSEVVQQINWGNDKIEIITSSGILHSSKALVTVSLGVLQHEKICFVPELPEKINAARQLGFGPVIKIILEFREAFWKNRKIIASHNLNDLSFLFSREEVPTWWTYLPLKTALLTGWLAGPRAYALKNNSKEDLLNRSLRSLQIIFELENGFLEERLQSWAIYNWAVDEYNIGGYAFEVVNGPRYRKTLKEPVNNCLFFAGEGLVDGPLIGTVEAALISGRETAHTIINSF